MTCFRIVIARIAPNARTCRVVTDACVHIGIKKPKGDVNALDLVEMILALKKLGQQAFPLCMTFQGFLCCVFVEFEGNDQIRL